MHWGHSVCISLTAHMHWGHSICTATFSYCTHALRTLYMYSYILLLHTCTEGILRKLTVHWQCTPYLNPPRMSTAWIWLPESNFFLSLTLHSRSSPTVRCLTLHARVCLCLYHFCPRLPLTVLLCRWLLFIRYFRFWSLRSRMHLSGNQQCALTWFVSVYQSCCTVWPLHSETAAQAA